MCVSVCMKETLLEMDSETETRGHCFSPLANVTHSVLCPERRDRWLNGCESEYICSKGTKELKSSIRCNAAKWNHTRHRRIRLFYQPTRSRFLFMSVKGLFFSVGAFFYFLFVLFFSSPASTQCALIQGGFFSSFTKTPCRTMGQNQ